MSKIFFFFSMLIALFSCKRDAEIYLGYAEQYIDSDPTVCLKYLDSIKYLSDLSLSQTVTYYHLKWQATFQKEGDLIEFVPLLNISQYWLKHKDVQKAAYCYLYNGIISINLKLYEQAAICFREAEQLALKQQDDILLFYTSYYKGNLLFINHEYQEGRIVLNKALDHYPFTDTLRPLGDLLKIATCYWLTRQYDKAGQYFQQIQRDIHTGADSTMTARMISHIGYSKGHKKLKREMVNYFTSNFQDDSLIQIYNKMILTELYLRQNRLDTVARLLYSLSKEELSKNPETMLQYYRIKGIYYLKEKKEKKAFKAFERYVHYNDSLSTNSLNTRLNTVINEYVQTKLEHEINTLKTSRIILILAVVIIFLIACLIFVFTFISQKKKNEKIIESELLIETLKNLCSVHEERQDKVRSLLASKLDISHKLVQLSTDEIPKNISFLKMYNELIGSIQPTELDWNELYQLIDCLYDDFHKKLLQYFPELTDKDIQVCCLLCGGFKTEEICCVIKQTVFSVHKRKTMIRKKLGLAERTDIVIALQECFKKR